MDIDLLGGCNTGGCVLLVSLENTLSSVARSLVRRDRVGEEGGVASDEVASLLNEQGKISFTKLNFNMLSFFTVRIRFNAS